MENVKKLKGVAGKHDHLASSVAEKKQALASVTESLRYL